MKNKILLFIVTVGFGLSAQAQTTVWNPAANEASTGNWNEEANWTAGIPGASGGKAVFNVPDAAPALVTDAQSVFQIVAGDNGDGGEIIVQDGGSITMGDVWSGVGYNTNAILTVEKGGEVTFGQHAWIGFLPESEGTVNINGGTIHVVQMTGLGWEGGVGIVNITSGLFDLANINATDMKSIGEGSYIDISGDGMMTINGNRLAHTGEDGVDYDDQLAEFITNERIIAHGGSVAPNYWFDEESAETKVIAPTIISSTMPEDASIEVPSDSDIVISFTRAMDATSVSENLTITPEIPNQQLSWSEDGSILTVSGDLAEGITYAVSLAKTAVDMYGFEVAFEESFTFIVEGDIVMESATSPEITLTMYPNPASDFISFDGKPVSKVEIYSASGQLMIKSRNVTNINIQSLNRGHYLVKAVVDETAVTRRLIVK
ncbi:T9SS type A sorting domain-containing protein [Reichenbachiella ulvae]|uniref:T9SS type A sorting domain-containing protein n=1 Tax=Reichenbachiella ulvae TaxID=2980104 RepID=A0ABT3CNP2_9BACT|nr:T9SS type A sorting domain-containing protein [Reichenbachiella ulvae]MCV9385257.1 T9SS type A sorting domain-containing protein [Reichenbachiella ulvae]